MQVCLLQPQRGPPQVTMPPRAPPQRPADTRPEPARLRPKNLYEPMTVPKTAPPQGPSAVQIPLLSSSKGLNLATRRGRTGQPRKTEKMKKSNVGEAAPGQVVHGSGAFISFQWRQQAARPAATRRGHQVGIIGKGFGFRQAHLRKVATNRIGFSKISNRA